MFNTAKPFHVRYQYNSGEGKDWFATYDDAVKYAQVKTARDNDGDEFVVLQAVALTRQTPPDNVEVVKL